jgi:Flp pilus assembly protein TadG
MKKKFLLPRSAKGQSLVELAISLVILLYLLGGAVEFGIIFFQFVQLRDAAQEGALYGSINAYYDANSNGAIDAGEEFTANEAKIKERARAASDSPIDLNDPAVDIQVSLAPGSTEYCEGNGLKVTVTFTHNIFMPFVPQILGRNSIPLTAEVTDTILTPVCPP